MRTWNEQGTEVKAGEVVTSFAKDKFIFVKALRSNEEGRDGKVTVQIPEGQRGAGEYRDFYARVVGLIVGEDNQSPCPYAQDVNNTIKLCNCGKAKRAECAADI